MLLQVDSEFPRLPVLQQQACALAFESHAQKSAGTTAFANAGPGRHGTACSRSHAAAGSLKTDAPTRALHDIFRAWVKTHPVTREKISAGSPTLKLLDKEWR